MKSTDRALRLDVRYTGLMSDTADEKQCFTGKK
jgi:hypothetical protein